MREEKRKHSRYDTELKVFFHVDYDIQTKVEFELIDMPKEDDSKYVGISKNISVEGICFTSDKQLDKGDMLYLEVYTPNSKKAVAMEGEVRWIKPLEDNKFQTGVKIILVDNQPVEKTIYYDQEYKLNWSIVLEEVFGSFKEMVEKSHKDKEQK